MESQYRFSFYTKFEKLKTHPVFIYFLLLLVIYLFCVIIPLIQWNPPLDINIMNLFPEIRSNLLLAFAGGLLLIYLPPIIERNKKISLIETLIYMNNCQDALEKIKLLLETSSNNWYVLTLLARVKIELKDYEEAWKALEIAEKITRFKKIDIMNNKALLYFKLQNFSLAKDYNDDAIKHNSNDYRAILLKMNIYLIDRDWNSIIHLYLEKQKILRKSQSFWIDSLILYYQALKETENTDKIKELIDIISPKREMSPMDLFNLAIIFHSENEFSKLKQTLELIDFGDGNYFSETQREKIRIWKAVIKKTECV